MLPEIAYYPIFDIPTIVYFGVTTITLCIITALLAVLIRRIIKTNLSWNNRIAYLSLTIGIIHGRIGLIM